MLNRLVLLVLVLATSLSFAVGAVDVLAVNRSVLKAENKVNAVGDKCLETVAMTRKQLLKALKTTQRRERDLLVHILKQTTSVSNGVQTVASKVKDVIKLNAKVVVGCGSESKKKEVLQQAVKATRESQVAVENIKKAAKIILELSNKLSRTNRNLTRQEIALMQKNLNGIYDLNKKADQAVKGNNKPTPTPKPTTTTTPRPTTTRPPTTTPAPTTPKPTTTTRPTTPAPTKAVVNGTTAAPSAGSPKCTNSGVTCPTGMRLIKGGIKGMQWSCKVHNPHFRLNEKLEPICSELVNGVVKYQFEKKAWPNVSPCPPGFVRSSSSNKNDPKDYCTTKFNRADYGAMKALCKLEFIELSFDDKPGRSGRRSSSKGGKRSSGRKGKKGKIDAKRLIGRIRDRLLIIKRSTRAVEDVETSIKRSRKLIGRARKANVKIARAVDWLIKEKGNMSSDLSKELESVQKQYATDSKAHKEAVRRASKKCKKTFARRGRK